MRPRSFAVVGIGVGATVVAAAGITCATAVGSTPVSRVHQAARPVQRAAPPAVLAPVSRPVHHTARPVQRAAPPASLVGGRSAGREKDEGRDGGGRDYGHREDGKIYFNERTYSAKPEGCIAAVGSSSFSVFNDSRRTIEVFRGFSCDDGPPVAVIGPHDDTFGTVTRTDLEGAFGEDAEALGGLGGVFGDDGVVGSFRVVGDHGER